MYDREQNSPTIGRDQEIKDTYEATIITTATTPSDDVYVAFLQFEPEGTDLNNAHRHGPCRGWDRRYDGTYPHKGDSAIVTVGDLGSYWMLNWKPAS